MMGLRNMIYFNTSVLAFLVLAEAACAQTTEPQTQLGFIKGFSWGWPGMREEYLGDKPEKSMELLAGTGTEWIVLAFAGTVATKNSFDLKYAENNPNMVTDDEIRHAIELARKYHFKIIMKPVVNPMDGQWRAFISFKTPEDWDKWWQNYQAFLLHYAQIAAETKCEMFCLGCEMNSMEADTERWHRLIAEVRKIYAGPITYNVNHDNLDVAKWFDAVDVIGISAYYKVATAKDTSLERMLESWKPIRQRLHDLSDKWKKPILLIEMGVRSAATSSTMPWDSTHQEFPYDAEEQARFYEAAFQTFWNEPWCLGFCWWDWKAHLYDPEAAKTGKDFAIYGKPAEDVVRTWYAKPH